MSRRARSHGVLAIFAIPALLALVSAVGLISALLTDGVGDLPWTIAIAAPLLSIMMALLTRRR